jgi:hypothetical protein
MAMVLMAVFGLSAVVVIATNMKTGARPLVLEPSVTSSEFPRQERLEPPRPRRGRAAIHRPYATAAANDANKSPGNECASLHVTAIGSSPS